MANNQGTGDDILLNVNVTGRENIQGARNDAKALKAEAQGGANVDMAKPVLSLRQQLRLAIVEAQKLAGQGKQNTEEFRNAAKRVADIRDRTEDLNRTFKAFDPDNKFKVFVTAASAGAKIVQGYAGAMAFLGVKSEDAAKTIAQLQGIMAFADAIGSLHDLKDSYKDLLSLLGLNTKAAQVAADSQAELAAEGVATAETQTAAQATVTDSAAISAAAQVASQDAVNAARAQGVTSIQELITIGNAAYEQTLQQVTANTALTESQIALAEAEGLAAEGAVAETVVMGGAAAAEEGATVSAIGLGTALKAIGIGLIISALAYLISNFDKVKKVVTDLFPGLKKAGDLFDQVKEVAFGVGNVILQYIIAPIKVLIDLLKGDFKGALQDLKDGFNVVKNFTEGYNKEAADIAEQHRIERVKLEIAANERIIKERKALGENLAGIAALEIANQKLKNSILDKDDKDYIKNKLDGESELTVLINSEAKRRNDIYKAALKTDLDAIKANEKENLKTIAEGAGNQRQIEINAADYKYQLELDLLNKRKAANKNYNKDYADLVTARKIEEGRINKKYDDILKAYNDKADHSLDDEYKKRLAQNQKDFEEASKAATTPQQLAKLQQNKAFIDNQTNAESVASAASSKAQTNLTSTEDKDRPNPRDTAAEASQKVSNIEAAKQEAEDAAYNLKKTKLAGQYDELAQLDAEHESKKKDIEQEGADARKAIAEAETEARLKLFDALGAGASAASDLLGDSTIAGKALAIASATINTYAAIAGQLAAFSTVPIPGYAIAQAIATGLVGLAQVKKILQVKVPAKSGGSGSGQASTAPQINTTVLQQANAGTANIVDAVNNNNQPKAPLKAYIVGKDLDDQKAQTDYFNAQSTY